MSINDLVTFVIDYENLILGGVTSLPVLLLSFVKGFTGCKIMTSSSSDLKRKRKNLFNHDKLKFIQQIERGKKLSHLAQEANKLKSPLATWLKIKKSLRQSAEMDNLKKRDKEQLRMTM